jgi:hypothetical protein
MEKFARTLVLFAIVLPCLATDEKKSLTVRGVAFTSNAIERTSTYTTPGTSNTNCSGSATTVGNTTNGSANCQTTSNPAQIHQVNSRVVDVMNIVDSDGMRYKIVCRASWIGSNCAPLIEGDTFPAEIDNHIMWIKARKGGNQGKEIRVKYKILDIRPSPPPQN